MPELQLKNNTYNKMKPAVQIWLPAAGTLYFALSQIWSFPYTEEVVGTIAALTVFFGTVLGISSKNYQENMDGMVVVDHTDPMKDNYSLELNMPFHELDELSEVRLKVQNDSQENQGL